MEHKSIYLDGVDVSGCEYYDHGICNIPDVIETYDSCIDKDTCHYKQLQRKTAECEELKKQLETSEEWRIKAESLNEKLELNNCRYRKALEEIESICLEDVHTFADGTELRYDSLDDILYIINKAKGGEDKQ